MRVSIRGRGWIAGLDEFELGEMAADGIVECENQAGEEYGEKRFRASVRRAAALDAGEMRDAIVGEATAYFGDTPRKDDITMIVGRIH
jgi:serine phosphatase RsbU (regulator of sigma subunit)